MPDLWPEDPRLAATYNAECAGRRDHAFYIALATDVGATSVVDIGCGTGVFAVDLADRGHHVIGVDPAEAILDIARSRPGGESVTWIHGVAADVAADIADLVVMMGHVAQYFVADDEWSETLGEIHRILVPGGHVAFEVRNPAIDWSERWTAERTTGTHPHPDGGTFTSWVEVVSKTGSTESYQATHRGHSVMPDGLQLECLETLRFRSADEVRASLAGAEFEIEQSWGDWDRSPITATSDEFIVLARRL